ncbi:MAG: xanthine dehydrogenase family protein subunit M [Sneathiella sp.]
MKSTSFEYVRARSIDEVFVFLGKHGDEAKILAGGQSLLPAMNMRLAAPEVLIDVSQIPDLQGIEMLGNRLRIGAMSRHVDVLNSSKVAEHTPLIASATRNVAHPAIRNRGTFGGSLCHADPASELPACALALGASFNIQNRSGSRAVKAKDFFQGTYTTCLEDDEILTSVDVPLAPADTMTFFEEFSRRKGDYAMAGLAARAEIQGQQINDVKLVFFAVSDVATSAQSAEKLLSGALLGTVDTEAICQAVSGDITPFDDLTTSGATKSALMKTLTRRALQAFATQGEA